MSATRASAAHAHDSGEAAVMSVTGQDVEEREERSAEEVVPEPEAVTPEEEAPMGATGRFAR
ncbi:hypothetical protein, partial [Streptomyces sp. NPDC002690]